MKSFKILSLLCCILSLGFMSCIDENNTEYNKGNEPLEVTASKDVITLDAQNPASEAVKFSWTSGTNYGTGLAIDYTFEMDVDNGNFENGIVMNIGRNIYEQAFKNEDLNNLLLQKFGIKAGQKVVLKYRVIAKVADDAIAKEISPLGNLDLTTHYPISNTLYLLGSAAPNGWDASLATPLHLVSNASKSFSWTGNLNVGEFKLITTLGEFLPSYNKGDQDYKIVLRQTEDEPDAKFQIAEAGTYSIKVNLITLAIEITKKEGPEYSQLWFVGNPNGWSFEAMTVDPQDPYVFHFNQDLSNGGEFKVATVNNNWDGVFFRPEIDGTSEGKDLKVVKWAGDPDHKWNITGGVYKIKLDTKDMLMDIVPYTAYPTVYLVGDAFPSGWTIDDAIAMDTKSTYVSTWTGSLNVGELKFSLDKQNDWNGAWFLASDANKTPTGTQEQMIFSKVGAGVDYKWKIAEAGTYTIEIDQLKETVTIKKQ